MRSDGAKPRDAWVRNLREFVCIVMDMAQMEHRGRDNARRKDTRRRLLAKCCCENGARVRPHAESAV